MYTLNTSTHTCTCKPSPFTAEGLQPLLVHVFASQQHQHKCALTAECSCENHCYGKHNIGIQVQVQCTCTNMQMSYHGERWVTCTQRWVVLAGRAHTTRLTYLGIFVGDILQVLSGRGTPGEGCGVAEWWQCPFSLY